MPTRRLLPRRSIADTRSLPRTDVHRTHYGAAALVPHTLLPGRACTRTCVQQTPHTGRVLFENCEHEHGRLVPGSRASVPDASVSNTDACVSNTDASVSNTNDSVSDTHDVVSDTLTSLPPPSRQQATLRTKCWPRSPSRLYFPTLISQNVLIA